MQSKNNFTLSNEEIYRYSRQIVLPEIGKSGQQKLKNAAVLIVGAGGLGSIPALYLAAAGVGRIGIVDGDVVDISNLHRQVIYEAQDNGKPKAQVTGEKLKARNPHINVEVFKEFLTAENAEKTVRNFDYIIDGSDNFATRYLLNDIAVFQKKPLINGSVYRFHGQVSVFNSMTGPCYRCLYPDPPRPEEIGSCVSGGVMGVVPGIVGMIQAGETIKMICETGAYLSGKLLVLNILNWDFLTVKISKNPACKICGPNPEITALIDYENFCGEGESDIPGEFEISAPELESKLKTKGRFRVLDIRESTEADICRLENSELVPQREINHYLSRLNPEEEIILYCRSGIRSARAISVFREHGFTNVRHLRGGILAWIDEVDPSLARY